MSLKFTIIFNSILHVLSLTYKDEVEPHVKVRELKHIRGGGLVTPQKSLKWLNIY